MKKMLCITLEMDLFNKIEQSRGQIPRSAFIEGKLKEVVK
jgi:hypothetical protein